MKVRAIDNGDLLTIFHFHLRFDTKDPQMDCPQITPVAGIVWGPEKQQPAETGEDNILGR